tara:strand:- start:5403 stop:5693 length:291 start_codon:yes stop_codon:yes gene_type:complete
MSTKKTNKVNFTEKVNTAIASAKSNVKKANDYALNTTEEIVIESITVAGQWQKVTDKALKGGVKLLENQQNLVFDALDTYKNHFIKGKKRFTKIFA